MFGGYFGLPILSASDAAKVGFSAVGQETGRVAGPPRHLHVQMRMQIGEKVPKRLKEEVLFVFVLPVVGADGELESEYGEEGPEHLPLCRFAVF